MNDILQRKINYAITLVVTLHSVHLLSIQRLVTSIKEGIATECLGQLTPKSGEMERASGDETNCFPQKGDGDSGRVRK